MKSALSYYCGCPANSNLINILFVLGSSDLQQFLQQPGQQYRVIQQQPYVVQQQQQQLVQQQQQVVQQQPQQQQKMIQHGMEDMVPQYINVNGKLVKE